MKRHILFDLDGTLARTGEDIILAWKGALRELGRDLTHFDEIFRIGPPLEKVVYELYDDATPELVRQLLIRFKPLYDEGGFPNTVPYAGIPEALAALKARGTKLYIVTNKRHAPTQGIAAKFGWDSFLDGVWSFDSFGTPFTKSELIAKILAERGIAPETAAMVGDTRGDIDAGRANALATCGVTWGYGSREEIAEANMIFETPSQLLTL